MDFDHLLSACTTFDDLQNLKYYVGHLKDKYEKLIKIKDLERYVDLETKTITKHSEILIKISKAELEQIEYYMEQAKERIVNKREEPKYEPMTAEQLAAYKKEQIMKKVVYVKNIDTIEWNSKKDMKE